MSWTSRITEGTWICPDAPLGCFHAIQTSPTTWRTEAIAMATRLSAEIAVYEIRPGTPVLQPHCAIDDLDKGRSWTKVHHVHADGTIHF